MVIYSFSFLFFLKLFDKFSKKAKIIEPVKIMKISKQDFAEIILQSFLEDDRYFVLESWQWMLKNVNNSEDFEESFQNPHGEEEDFEKDIQTNHSENIIIAHQNENSEQKKSSKSQVQATLVENLDENNETEMKDI